MSFINAYTPANLLFLLEGFGVTLKVAFISIVFSFIIGGAIGTCRFAKIEVLSNFLAAIVETIRNLPILLIIFFTYFALPEIGIKLEIVPAAIIALTLFHSAMFSEIVRGGLKSIDKGQTEAALSSGLTYYQTLVHIIIPQGLKRMVPPTVSQFISLVKDTSLAVVISLPELTHHSQIIYGQSYSNFIPIMLLVAFMYFAVNYGLSLIARRLELKNA